MKYSLYLKLSVQIHAEKLEQLGDNLNENRKNNNKNNLSKVEIYENFVIQNLEICLVSSYYTWKQRLKNWLQGRAEEPGSTFES